MLINKTSIKSRLGISTTTYDNKIELLIPSIIKKVCQYCNHEFIFKNKVMGFVYDLTSMVFTTTTITLTTDLPLIAGDFIKIYGSVYNDDIYQVKTYTGGVITVETSKTMRPETKQSCYIALVSFPDDIFEVVAKAIDRLAIKELNVTKESIDDYSVDFKDYSDILSELNNYRKVFSENIFERDV